jgi:hypothetical protein
MKAAQFCPCPNVVGAGRRRGERRASVLLARNIVAALLPSDTASFGAGQRVTFVWATDAGAPDA